MHKIKKHISVVKILWLLTNRFFGFFYKIFLFIGRHVNDISIKNNLDTDLIRNFRSSKQEALKNIVNAAKIFSWALHETDGRHEEFHDFDKTAWDRWLRWYKFHHFNWKKPTEDKRIQEMEKSIRALGRKTWANLFKCYGIPILDRHDLYSLPDVYYVTSVLGHMPSAVIDIGGGWGRLGMAWTAVGVKTVGITDSIEQPYIMQNQYLRSVPDVHFHETLGDRSTDILKNFKKQTGIVHFPLWQIIDVPNESVEVISAIQVLREINCDCLEFLLSEIWRVLKHGGLFYIRDNDPEYKEDCMHNVNISKKLLEIGFKLRFKSDLIHGKDIHGLPRIFQKL